MRSYSAALALLTMFVGCRAPMPSFDVLAPYGSTRVPPPPTGSFGTPDSYYQTPAYPPQGTTSPSSAVGTGLRARVPDDRNWTASRGEQSVDSLQISLPTPASTTGIAVASHEAPVTNRPIDRSNRIRVVDGRSKSVLRRTTGSEPRRFEAPRNAVEITDLPPVVRSRAITTRGSLTAAPVEARVVRGNASETWRARGVR